MTTSPRNRFALSRDGSFLAKFVCAGTRQIRASLDGAQILYEKDDRTIALLEKLLNEDDMSGEARRLSGLRTVQLLRTKLKGHVGGSDANKLAQEALMEHETFANHFWYVCEQISEELETIEALFE